MYVDDTVDGVAFVLDALWQNMHESEGNGEQSDTSGSQQNILAAQPHSLHRNHVHLFPNSASAHVSGTSAQRRSITMCMHVCALRDSEIAATYREGAQGTIIDTSYFLSVMFPTSSGHVPMFPILWPLIRQGFCGQLSRLMFGVAPGPGLLLGGGGGPGDVEGWVQPTPPPPSGADVLEGAEENCWCSLAGAKATF